jgi:hypothetical protein
LYGAIFDHHQASGRPLLEAKIDTSQHKEQSFPFMCVPVTDQAEVDEAKKERDVLLMISHIVEDTRGVPNPTCCKQAPSVVGVDPTCNQRGVTNKTLKTTVYPGAVRHLGQR